MASIIYPSRALRRTRRSRQIRYHRPDRLLVNKAAVGKMKRVDMTICKRGFSDHDGLEADIYFK
jgi:hypothetical protein